VVAICIASVAVIFLATRIRRVPLPAAVLLGTGGLTYPLYLLHMQMGYVLWSALAEPTPYHVVLIVSAITLLSFAVWRYVERPAQRWTKDILARHAADLGWPSRLNGGAEKRAQLPSP
jgi:peptidoglycan/LPS O-acetylase OafA/YrhL